MTPDMTRKQLRRAAALANMLVDIEFELAPPEADRKKLAEENPPPLGLVRTSTVKLLFEDDGGCLRMITTIDAGFLYDALGVIAGRIRAELKDMGIAVEP